VCVCACLRVFMYISYRVRIQVLSVCVYMRGTEAALGCSGAATTPAGSAVGVDNLMSLLRYRPARLVTTSSLTTPTTPCAILCTTHKTNGETKACIDVAVIPASNKLCPPLPPAHIHVLNRGSLPTLDWSIFCFGCCFICTVSSYHVILCVMLCYVP
jgi:hypothetical protein